MLPNPWASGMKPAANGIGLKRDASVNRYPPGRSSAMRFAAAARQVRGQLHGNNL
jgi:hypothetical protein